MSRITQSKLNRRLLPAVKDKLGKIHVVGRHVGFEPAPLPKKQLITYEGVTFEVLVSPGQIINPKKAYKRYLQNKIIWH